MTETKRVFAPEHIREEYFSKKSRASELIDSLKDSGLNNFDKVQQQIDDYFNSPEIQRLEKLCTVGIEVPNETKNVSK